MQHTPPATQVLEHHWVYGPVPWELPAKEECPVNSLYLEWEVPPKTGSTLPPLPQ